MNKINCPNDIYKFIEQNILFNRHQEEFYIICLNARKEVINFELLFKGTVSCIQIHLRDIFRYAIEQNTSYIVAAHNHPTGDVTPSSDDLNVTIRMSGASELLSIPILDHIIYSENGFYSFREEGSLM